MTKNLVTIDIQDKNLKSSAKTVTSKKVKPEEKKEIETFGIVEINNSSSAKKVKSNVERGFEKNVSGESKKTVKSKVSQVEDYFDFSFRKDVVEKNANLSEKNEKTTTKTAKSATKAKTTTAKTTARKTTAKKQDAVKEEVSALKIDNEIETEKVKNTYETVDFDSEANQIIRVARIGSLFDCDIRMMNA